MDKLLCIGEVMLELSQVNENSYKKSFAGDTFNVAHYAAITGGEKIETEYLTAIGTDNESDACFEFIAANNVGVRHIIRDENRTIGLFLLSNDDEGEKKYNYWRSVAAAKYVFNQPRDLSGFNLINISGITAAITIEKDNLIASLLQAKNKGAKIIYDFNYRQMLWSVEDAKKFALKILPLVDIAKISDEELETLFPSQSLQGFSKEYPNAEWIFTCGGEKAEVWQSGDMIAQKIFEPITDIVDTSAAGDSFLGTYLSSYLMGFDAAQRLKRAHRIAVQVIAHKGSIVSIDLTKLEI